MSFLKNNYDWDELIRLTSQNQRLISFGDGLISIPYSKLIYEKYEKVLNNEQPIQIKNKENKNMNKRRQIALAYLATFGDVKPTECTAGVTESFYCPECHGEGTVYQQTSDGVGSRYVECSTCNGVGYFDHMPKAKFKQIGWE